MSGFTGARYGVGKPMEMPGNVLYQSKQYIKYLKLLEKKNRRNRHKNTMSV